MVARTIASAVPRQSESRPQNSSAESRVFIFNAEKLLPMRLAQEIHSVSTVRPSWRINSWERGIYAASARNVRSVGRNQCVSYANNEAA
jgi:hypothetical protein